MKYENRRRGPRKIFAGLFLLGLGVVLLLQNYYPAINFSGYIWPGILIFIGLGVLLRPRRYAGCGGWGEEFHRHRFRHHREWRNMGPQESTSTEDFIDSTSGFGSVRRKIVSKNFRGGDIVSIMGYTVIDLTEADFKGTIRLDVTQVMGGTKIIVPADWEVRSDVSAVFAGFEDKRDKAAITNPEKVLLIDGTSVFGGIEVKNKMEL